MLFVKRWLPLLALLLTSTLGHTGNDDVVQDVEEATPEAEDFDVVKALEKKNVHVHEIAALTELTGEARVSTTTSCRAACLALQEIFGEINVLLPTSPDLALYLQGYFSSVQAETAPACVFKAIDATSISIVVLLSRYTQCPIAVKSGGHGLFPGASNIEGGITVSLQNMKAVSFSEDKSTVTAGPGWKWGELYRELASHDLVVVGGRVATVGVGGLTTGGGIAFLSNRYGWACDNIASFGLVTASGAHLNVNSTTHPDLFSALRGSGPNFGIVTSFTFRTFPLPAGQIWGGSRIYLTSEIPAALQAWTTVADSIALDTNAGGWLAFTQNNGSEIAVAETYYARPDGQNASIWREFDAIPSIYSDTANRHIADYADKVGEQAGGPGRRELFYAMTWKNDLELNTAAFELFRQALVESDVSSIEGARFSFVFQCITKEQIRYMQTNGGNALGLKEEDGPLTLLDLNPAWSKQEDDERVYRFSSDLLKKIKRAAVDRGMASDYVYMNYASQYQDVIASYGEEAKAKLLAVSRKWDPKGVWQKIMPGYFKLDGAPVRGTDYFSF